MSKPTYRRKAILSLIHNALNAFYLLQKIDWKYNIAESLEKILGLALEEIELDGEKNPGEIIMIPLLPLLDIQSPHL